MSFVRSPLLIYVFNERNEEHGFSSIYHNILQFDADTMHKMAHQKIYRFR